MRAVAEGEMATRAAGNVENLGVVEGERVAIGGAEHEEDALAPGDGFAAQRDVFGGDAGDGVGGPLVTQDFLDRAGGERRVGAQRRKPFGALQQQADAVADEVGRRFVAGEEEQGAVGDEFLLAQGVVGVARGDQGVDEGAVRAFAPTPGHGFLKIGVEGGERRGAAFEPVGVVARAADDAGDVVGPGAETVDVAIRNAEEMSDNGGGAAATRSRGSGRIRRRVRRWSRAARRRAPPGAGASWPPPSA